jgi:hypothetical protein
MQFSQFVQKVFNLPPSFLPSSKRMIGIGGFEIKEQRRIFVVVVNVARMYTVQDVNNIFCFSCPAC